MKILIIGIGSIGSRHYDNLNSFIEIGLYDQKRKRLNTKKNTIKFKSLEEALKWEPDGVIISTSTNSHIKIAKKVIQSGCKKLLIEKPISDSLKESIKLEKLAKKNNVNVFVVTNLRFHIPLEIIRKFF